MEKVNVITSNEVSWKIVKPLNGKVMWNLTMTLLAGFVVSTYFLQMDTRLRPL